MPVRKCFLILILTLSLNTITQSQNTQRAIAILDLSIRNSETNNARLFSVEHMMNVVGIPFIITQDVAEASEYAMVFCSSLLNNNTFSSSEKDSLSSYVDAGGILFAPRVEDDDLYDLFGISGSVSNKSRYKIEWETNLSTQAFHYINEPEESTISLGRESYDEIYKTLGYEITTAQALAHYDDGAVAVTKNTVGDGIAISIGLSWKEVILRNQINRDYEAQRLSSNAFEPTSDVFMLFIRSLFIEEHPFTVWKNTSPGNSKSTLMVTHDIDSRTGMDTLSIFVDYEHDQNIVATCNVTVRYFDDELMSPFYLEQQSTLENIISKDHIIGSHSVGHFFDFADDDIFPTGEAGNTRENYNPFNDGTTTENGSVYGECEVSKNVLEEDLNVGVRTFRAGHLAYPRYLIDVLDELDYEYNSSYSAADVLTNFPYLNKKGRGFSTEVSSIYELPVTISDVFHSDPINANNYFDKAITWLSVVLKNRANGAPSVLLIHPNRNYKLLGMQFLIESLPSDFNIMEMGKFGDFWKAREALDFESTLNDDELRITLKGQLNLDDNISFVINNGQDLLPIIVEDEEGNVLDFGQANWEGNDVIVYYNGLVSNASTIAKSQFAINVFPNPTTFNINIAFELPNQESIQMELYDIQGKKVLHLLDEVIGAGKHQIQKNINRAQVGKGVYFLVVKTKTGIVAQKKLVLH